MKFAGRFKDKSRICSLPAEGYNPRCSQELYRLRSFSIKKGRLIKHGDSMESRKSKPASNNGSRNTSNCVSPMLVRSSTTSARMSPLPIEMKNYHHQIRVCMFGDAGVGKSSLVSQLLNSEHMNTSDASLGKILPFIKVQIIKRYILVHGPGSHVFKTWDYV